MLNPLILERLCSLLREALPPLFEDIFKAIEVNLITFELELVYCLPDVASQSLVLFLLHTLWRSPSRHYFMSLRRAAEINEELLVLLRDVL